MLNACTCLLWFYVFSTTSNIVRSAIITVEYSKYTALIFGASLYLICGQRRNYTDSITYVSWRTSLATRQQRNNIIACSRENTCDFCVWLSKIDGVNSGYINSRTWHSQTEVRVRFIKHDVRAYYTIVCTQLFSWSAQDLSSSNFVAQFCVKIESCTWVCRLLGGSSNI